MSEDIKEIKPVKKLQKRDYAYAVGRRKQSSARVRLYPVLKAGAVWGAFPITKEQILVNEMPIEHYFPGPVSKAKYMKPFIVAEVINKYAITVKVSGGGKSGQLDAVIHGIARVLSKHDEKKLRKSLKTNGLLTRDPRVRERRKVGTGGKARRKKQSPKR